MMKENFLNEDEERLMSYLHRLVPLNDSTPYDQHSGTNEVHKGGIHDYICTLQQILCKVAP